MSAFAGLSQMKFVVQTSPPLPQWQCTQSIGQIDAIQPSGVDPTIDDLKTVICRRLNDARISRHMYDVNGIQLEINGRNLEGGTHLNSFTADAKVL